MVNLSSVISMTGFATWQGVVAQREFSLELRSVNAKGLDLRLRLPEGYEALDPVFRQIVTRRVSRGSVSLALKLTSRLADSTLGLNAAALSDVLDALVAVQKDAALRGVALASASAAEILGLRGVIDFSGEEDVALEQVQGGLEAGLVQALDALCAMRRAEGAHLAEVLSAQVERIATLTQSAREAALARSDHVAATLKTALARVMDASLGADPQRVAQELAMIAVKSDISEELDRLQAHVAAARALLLVSEPIGRKFDFLTQEFLREANTLCSKAQFAELTAVGLEMKVTIDQMREQVQNIE